MTTAQPTPASIWKFTNQTAKALAFSRQFLKQLESGQITQPHLNVLKRHAESGDDDILFALGRRAGSTRNPAEASKHYRLLQVLGEFHESIAGKFWDKVKGDDPTPDSWLQTFTAEDFSPIAAEFKQKISDFTKEKLEAEAEDAVAWIEKPGGTDSGTGNPAKSRKPSKKPSGAKSGVRKSGKRITFGERALAELIRNNNIARMDDPIAELAGIIGCSVKSLCEARAPGLRKSIAAILGGRATATADQADADRLHMIPTPNR